MKTITLTFLTVLLFLSSYNSFSQWTYDPDNPEVVCDLSGVQSNVRSFADGSGGAYVFWLDNRNNQAGAPREIYGQHYDSQGYKLWESDGRLVMTHYNAIMNFEIGRNSNGTMVLGMITKGASSGGGDTLRFQMLNDLGESTWSSELVTANAGSNSIIYLSSFQMQPVDNEFYVLLQVIYMGGSNGNRFIRFNADGDLLVSYQGAAVGNQSYVGASYFAQTYDNTGDFYLFYATGNGSGASLHCYRFNNAGTSLWGPVDVTQGTSGLSYQLRGASDPYGITFVWQGNGTGGVDLLSRRLTPGGALAWGGNTVDICSADGEQTNFDLKQKDMYVFVTWADGRPGTDPGYYDIYAQKLDTTGYLIWTPNGNQVASFNTYIPYPMLEVLDDYSIVVDHQSNVAGFMAQLVDTEGGLPWGPAAQEIAEKTFNPFYGNHTLFQSGENLIAVWNKSGNGGGADGVYIANIDLYTGLKEPSSGPSFTVYPNPAKDYVEIGLDNGSEASSISLYSISGKLIESRDITGINDRTVRLGVSELPAGVYFVRMTGITGSKDLKVVIQ
jgi:hypothetical protein